MYHGLYAKLVARPGEADRLAAILWRNLDELQAAGCRLYIVNLAADEADVIWVTEVWESAAHHAQSMKLPSVRSAMAEARPLLTGEFEQIRLRVAGGLGLPSASADSSN